MADGDIFSSLLPTHPCFLNPLSNITTPFMLEIIRFRKGCFCPPCLEQGCLSGKPRAVTRMLLHGLPSAQILPIGAFSELKPSACGQAAVPRGCGHLRPDDVAMPCPVSLSGSQREAHSALKESTNFLVLMPKLCLPVLGTGFVRFSYTVCGGLNRYGTIDSSV